MTKTKSANVAQGAHVANTNTNTDVTIAALMAQFAQMQAVMATLVPAVKEQATAPAAPAPAKGKGKKAETTAPAAPAKAPQTRAEGIAAWKAKKDAKATEVVTAPAILQVSEKGFLLVGNMNELEITRMTAGMEKYLTHVKRKSVAGKVYDGFSFSYKRVDAVKKAFGIK